MLRQGTGKDVPLPGGGPPRPSKLPPWSTWCTCDSWKALLLTETGTRDPNCKCHPSSILPEVVWCTCKTQRPTGKRTTKWREAKNLATTIGTEITETEKTPEPGKAKELNNTIGGETPKPEGKPIKTRGET